MIRSILLCTVLLLFNQFSFAQKNKSTSDDGGQLTSATFSTLKFRSIGPALTSGRIADIAVNPDDYNEYYVASASGGVWKTQNHGLTFKPIFDGQGSYSIGCVSIDPNNSNVIWVGTGENNNQRSVAYGDGLYKSIDGGASWKKVGLENSEHIGMIAINPENSDEVYVAAYGPLWSSGGDRGLYKTVDGGATWEKILHVSDNTGFNEVHLDPRDPNIIYAAAHQRRRRVWTYISGGPESNIYKSTDGGKSFSILSSGIPSGDKGRIGLAISPVNPDVVYAMIEGHGFYKSTNRGASFSFQNDYNTSGNYYVEIIAHPNDVNTIYSMDTYGHVSEDGGKSWSRIPKVGKHVDNHCIWINPKDSRQMIWGCDGGLYETWDNMQNWHFKPNLPVTQFYKVSVDTEKPFYYVYGGTQDNFSLGGPSRTVNKRGIVNSDWMITKTGDGYESVVDPENPNIIYTQSQYGGLARYDKLSGQRVDIKPVEKKGEPAFRWNWDAPLILSPHNHKTLYFAANKLFKSSDMGNSWQRISPDLSRQIDRNSLPVMGKVWGMDAVAKNRSTTIYGNIVALNESPLKSGLLYVGTDDGLIHMSNDDGENWTTYDSFSGVPDKTYVNDITPSLHNEGVVYAAFNNHKNGDFKPYVLKSKNNGKSWESIIGDLPERGSVYSIVEDHVNPDLLFAGTEFGVFCTMNGGEKWIQLKSGIPTIAIRDIEIQREENDLVLATFGRGFYILDDYSLLREVSKEILDQESHIFNIKDGLVVNEANATGYSPPGHYGASYFMANNPTNGAVISYYIKEKPKTLKELRKEKESESENHFYPEYEEIRAEDKEEKPYLIFVINGPDGKELRRFTEDYKSGINRFSWDGRLANSTYISDNNDPVTNNGGAMYAPSGKYQVKILQSVDGVVTDLTGSKEFKLYHLKNSSFRAEDQVAVLEFQLEIIEVTKKFSAVSQKYSDLRQYNKKLKAGIRNTPGSDISSLMELRKVDKQLDEIEMDLFGDASLSKREFETLPGLQSRLSSAMYGSWYSTSKTTEMQRTNLQLVEESMPNLIEELQKIQEVLDKTKEEFYRSGGAYLQGDLPK